ncbi:MAG TPA: glycosyltransferase family 9 protein [Gemmatimonadaceae bacterium]|nr:glycosyltransferase family 9 protein [Gemmatimonadaceae bacterium]
MSPPRGSALSRWRRRADRRIYRSLFGAYRAFFPSRRWEGPLDPARLHRVLVVRHDRIGDAVVTSPLLSLLHAALPHAEIDVLASPANHAVFAGDPRIARVFVNDHGPRTLPHLVRRLRARRYDAVFSVIFGRGLREGVLASLVSTSATYRISVHRPARYAGLFSVTFRAPRSRVHMAERLLWVAERALALPPTLRPASLARYPLALPEDPAAGARAEALLARLGLPRFALVNLWAAEPWREWPVAHLAGVVRLLRERGHAIPLLLLPPPGKEIEAAVAASACDGDARVAPPSRDLADLIALVRRAEIVLTPDTGVVHVASACDRPVVALYSTRTVDIECWTPVGVPHRMIVAPEGQPVSAIPESEVADALDSLHAELVATR